MSQLSNLQKTCIAAAIANACILPSTQAANIEVGPDCTLIEAIQTVNTNTVVSDCFGPDVAGPDTLLLPAGFVASYATGAYSYGGTINAALPTITSEVTIQGDASTGAVIERSLPNMNDFRLLEVAPGADLTLVSMTLRNGSATSAGAIYAYDAELTLQSCIVSNNIADFAGAIELKETNLTLTDSEVSGNTATMSFGGIYAYYSGLVEITNSDISNNTAVAMLGGGLTFKGDGGAANITGGSISNNFAGSLGGGIYVDNTVLTVIGVEILSNVANKGAGAYANTSTVTFDDATITDNSASDSGGALQIKAGTMLTITGSQLVNNDATGNGGAICLSNSQIGISSSSVAGSDALANGGVVFADDIDPAPTSGITFTESSFSNNSALIGGVVYSNVPALTVTTTTLSGNQASTAAGAIRHHGATFVLDTSTLSGNTAPLHSALDSDLSTAAGSAQILSSTIFNNNATGSGAEAASAKFASMPNIVNSVIAGSQGADCYSVSGNVTNNNSWFEDASCDGAAAGDSLLNDLMDNNAGLPGTTLTHAPSLSSPLLGAGNPGACSGNTDQRGAPRGSSSCDIGAVEGGIEGPNDTSCFVVKAANGATLAFCL